MKRWAVFSAVVANLLDIYTTFLPPGQHEANEIMRDSLHNPILKHMLVVKGSWYLCDILLLWILYKQVQKISQWLADFIVVIACLYEAWTYIDVLVGNYAVYLGWLK